MSEEKKKQVKQLRVGTLHIHADEIVLHQPEGSSSPNVQQGQNPTFQGPIARDFWGFPIRQVQAPQAQQPQAQEEASEEVKGEGVESNQEKTDETDDVKNEQESTTEQEAPQAPQGPQGPPFGWI
ncbi:hypothetical protein JOD43_000774 [Pullulanibacillus pueri]|uniref:Uncharacterized protein n=1 Tax=Pullulanibacillus pueri TaxID=1437324 RepID=A0A8J2ZX63_9BACL|nr:hypothetical protein [Pullulanibacillus pueri]MBM7680612.1 hypothetical protein [Pullulanibacillus pueri]GGH83941.1 hypothetical protein GCM10007096_25870 [Pullulanibacillus pueri]